VYVSNQLLFDFFVGIWRTCRLFWLEWWVPNDSANNRKLRLVISLWTDRKRFSERPSLDYGLSVSDRKRGKT